jgi:RimJ/RimL family protein N-acetyltransferase
VPESGQEERVMIDARYYNAKETLKNGIVVTIRAVRPDDKENIAKAFSNLDRESVYTRFFRFKNELTDDELRQAAEVDFEDIVALVVTKENGEEETIVGGGRYIAFAGPGDERRAEVAFIVEEDYQGLGIATRILGHLTGIAHKKGISAFEADVLSENRGMLTVFARSGLPMKQAYDGDIIHVTMSLA